MTQRWAAWRCRRRCPRRRCPRRRCPRRRCPRPPRRRSHPQSPRSLRPPRRRCPRPPRRRSHPQSPRSLRPPRRRPHRSWPRSHPSLQRLRRRRCTPRPSEPRQNQLSGALRASPTSVPVRVYTNSACGPHRFSGLIR